MNFAESTLPLTPDILEDLTHDDAYQAFTRIRLVVLVTGGRNYGETTEEKPLFARTIEVVTLEIALARANPDLLIHGDARGADSHADAWARQHDVARERYPAKWRQDGVFNRAAGHERNRVMANVLDWYRRQGKEVLVIAFPGGSGTAGMTQLAHDYGFPLEAIT